jgi:hypothetical protein
MRECRRRWEVSKRKRKRKRTQAHAEARNAKANQELNNQFLALLPTRRDKCVSSPSEIENYTLWYLDGRGRGNSGNLEQTSVDNDGRGSNTVMESDQKLAA